MSLADLLRIEEIADTATKATISFKVWQIILLIVAGKALHKMWIVINELQLIVYVGMWSISFLPECTIFLN